MENTAEHEERKLDRDMLVVPAEEERYLFLEEDTGCKIKVWPSGPQQQKEGSSSAPQVPLSSSC